MKRFNLKNLPIGTKIFLSFFGVFFIFASLSLYLYLNIKRDRENFLIQKNLIVDTLNILEIDKEISEIRRLTNVYSTTGSESILEKMKKSFSSIREKIYNMESKVKVGALKKQIEEMTPIFLAFGKNIDSLKERFEYKEKFLRKDLPEIYEKGGELFQASKTFNYTKKQEILKNWVEANLNAYKYIETRNYKFKEKYLKDIKFLKNNLDTKKDKEKFDLLSRFEKSLNQAVQANRVYLSLVTVVMTGNAIEITNISNRLRAETLKLLNKIVEENEENFNKTIIAFIIVFVLTLPLLIVLGAYYQVDIANNLKSLAMIFRKFIEGSEDENIPGISRGDEIGQLAKAAAAFNEANKMIKAEQQRVKQLAESKSKFLATMSHEIRTPMNAVLSCTNLLLDDVKDKEQVKLLDTILTSGDSLLVLINDILDFSKLEAGKLSLESHPFEFLKIIKDVVLLLEKNASLNNVKLTFGYEGDIPEGIEGDMTRLRQVIVNLIGNGIKFCEDKVELIVKGQKIENKYEFTITVRDNGPGIPKELQKELFQEFRQLDESTTRKHGGTGLGLAICKGIVEAMGGEIWVESEIGEGTSFIFNFRAREAVVEKRKSRVRLSDINSTFAAKYPLKILMAEDIAVNQMVAKKIMNKIGYRIDVVSNGVEAVDSVKGNKYDLVFMDQHMPEMDGLEATKQIRNLDINQPKIFALTASAFKEDYDNCIAAGMNGFLTKPIELGKLIAVISECVENFEDDIFIEQKEEIKNVPSVLSVDRLIEVFGGDQKFLTNIVDKILETVPSKLSDLKNAIEEKDRKKVEDYGHELKGVFSSLSLMSISNVFNEIQMYGKEYNFSDASTEVEKIESILMPFLNDLQTKFLKD